ncbi:hypothetical protein MATL_G00117220 [Megalops atlanticus]|uniref:Coiled-coil domain containing 9 n=1 Tax=Megalops atlanticus TaxID=7932 RepID=A0A9D3PZ41_MEGAT|nr:hypothetical protein MATL_G00117220 [Megalops atlanticus]
MSTAVDLKTKEEKDAELDRRIEALRKKNEALVRRYQEIEEDKKKAEQEGIAVTTPRKPRLHDADNERRRTEKENLTVTVDLSKPAGEKRVINDRKPGTPRGGRGPEEGEAPRSQGESPPRRTGSGRLSRGTPPGGPRQERREPRHDKAEPRQDRTEPRSDRPLWDSEAGEGPGRNERTPRGGRRGRGGGGGGGGGGTPQGGLGVDRKSKEWEEKRRQNIEKMNEEMEKIAEYERGQRGDGDKNPIRNFLDDPRRCGPIPDTDRKEGSRRHVRNWGGLDFDNVKTGAELEKEWTSRRPGAKGSVDMTLSMTGRERAEYLRWKKEREQIDEERLARHRNATGQWRREWDAQKTDTMFKEEAAGATEDTADHGSRRDDSKRPPKAPTFGDFLGQGKAKEGGRGGRGRGKGRAQNKSYSMHDNRWEAEKEDEKEKQEEKKPPSKEKVEVVVEKVSDGATVEEDEDEWEDASDGEEEVVEDESEEEEGVKKEAAHQEKAKGKTSPPPEVATTPAGPRGASDSPKEQRTPRPRVQIPSPQGAQDSPESTKPLSPFSPLEGYQPVSDWGEEMEMQSPRNNLGESPLKPSSAGTEGSPVAPKTGSPRPADAQEETQAPSPAAEPEKQDSGQIEGSSQVQEEPNAPDAQAHDAPAVIEPTDQASLPTEAQRDPAAPAPQDVPASSEADVTAPAPVPAPPPPCRGLGSEPSPDQLSDRDGGLRAAVLRLRAGAE